MKIWQFLDKQSRPVLLVVYAALVGLVGWLDYLTGYEFSFALFYLIPVGMAAWHGGLWVGTAVALLGAGTVHYINQKMGPEPSSHWVWYWNLCSRLLFFLFVSLLIVRLRAALRREKQQARADHLTGVANRLEFFDRMTAELERHQRYRHPLTICYLDLDDFKLVNDRFGHGVGDKALRTVAQTISQHIRSTDCMARLGGDEFALLLPETSAVAAQAALSKLQSVLQAEAAKQGWPISFSIGALTFVQAPPDVNEMVRQADELMYVAKRKGKNRVEHIVQAVA